MGTTAWEKGASFQGKDRERRGMKEVGRVREGEREERDGEERGGWKKKAGIWQRLRLWVTLRFLLGYVKKITFFFMLKLVWVRLLSM